MVDLELDNKIIDFIRVQGPVLPVKITKVMNADILFASAKLSELVSKKLVRISSANIGGSPVYYLSGQEAKLEMLYKYLPEKEKESYNLLKEKKVLKDKGCEPGIRVALRSIKDFAIPFQINNQLFWRWYLSSEQELTPIVNGLLNVKEEKIKEPEIKKEELKIEKQKKLKIEKPKVVDRPKKKVVKKKDEFLILINDYLKEKEFNVLDDLEIKKNKEVCKLITINSDVGELNYLLYAKNKKKISDSDLGLAYSKAQEKKTPVLFVSNGELSKKAEKFLDENSLVIFEQI